MAERDVERHNNDENFTGKRVKLFFENKIDCDTKTQSVVPLIGIVQKTSQV